MKKTTCIALVALTVLMLLALPLVVPTGSMLSDYQELWSEWAWDSEALLPVAYAEEEAITLPIDLTAGQTPNPAAYGEDSYADDSITVRVEHITDESKNLSWRVAYITIRDASQLRTGVAGKNIKSERTASVASMAERYNAVIAINGDYYINDTAKKSFEYRMGEKIRSKTNARKDLLIIDENGDFHIVLMNDKDKQQAEINAIMAEHQIINAFTFGPALIRDGELLDCPDDYNYNPNGAEPRMAIGQLDTLSYVIVMAEGRGSYADGVTHQELADFMFDTVGCMQAYNLDGGNSGTMVLGERVYKADHNTSKLRDMNDCIYFATTVDPSTWSN